jgi:hypothetical protein
LFSFRDLILPYKIYITSGVSNRLSFFSRLYTLYTALPSLQTGGQKAGEQKLPEGEGRQEHGMVDEIRWGRVGEATAKQKALLAGRTTAAAAVSTDIATPLGRKP